MSSKTNVEVVEPAYRYKATTYKIDENGLQEAGETEINFVRQEKLGVEAIEGISIEQLLIIGSDRLKTINFRAQDFNTNRALMHLNSALYALNERKRCLKNFGKG